MDDLPRPRRLLGRSAIAARCRDLRGRGRRIVFTNGCFDLVHPGHVLYLAEARALGDLLVVGVNTDAQVRALKGAGRPLVDEMGRATVLLGLRSVDFVSVFDEPTPRELILAVRPDILVKGGDYRLEDVVGRTEVESWGGTTLVLPYRRGYSTSRLAERLARPE